VTAQGKLVCRQRQDASAQGLASSGLARQERHLEPTHVQIGERLSTLALLCGKQGHDEQTEPLVLLAGQTTKNF